MVKQRYTTVKGVEQWRPKMSLESYSVARDDMFGFCLHCGEYQEGVEPDARRYKCEICGHDKVYGLEELLLMGLVAV